MTHDNLLGLNVRLFDMHLIRERKCINNNFPRIFLIIKVLPSIAQNVFNI